MYEQLVLPLGFDDEAELPSELDVMSDYDRICQFDSLYKAHCKARRGKRTKAEVIHFEMDLANNIVQMSELLKAREYHMNGYYHFKVVEPKEREIFAAHYRDRVLLHCVCDEVLVPLFERRLIYDNAACRPGKGSHFALGRLKKFLREHYREHGCEGYVLKCDISQYFASIDHDVLLRKLRRVVKDKEVLALIEDYVRSFHTEGKPGKGLPLGNQSSQLFALYYMDAMDRMVKERLRCKHYIRYMDDFLVVHHDRKFLERALEAIRHHLEAELDLSLNEKTRIIPLSQGVEFLGWRFFLTETGAVKMRLRRSTKRRFSRRMKKLARDYLAGKANDEDIRAVVDSYKGHLKHGNAHIVQRRVFDEFYKAIGGGIEADAHEDSGGRYPDSGRVGAAFDTKIRVAA